MRTERVKIVVCGAGAAGYFAAVNCARTAPQANVVLIEGSSKPLAKVAVSGGGRCNVTHNCFEPAELVKNYPRGGRELRGPFSRFQPQHTIDWFSDRGVKIKTEADGRMFPITDSSQTIIDALQAEAEKTKVQLLLKTKLETAEFKGDRFTLTLEGKTSVTCDALIVTTGSSGIGHKIAQSFGHTITELAPSLFTFKIDSPLLEGFAGTSFQDCSLRLTVLSPKASRSEQVFKQQGPALITHWGLSGPAVLKLSAWAARELHAASYAAQLNVNWLGSLSTREVHAELRSFRSTFPQRLVAAHPMPTITRRFWESLLEFSGIAPDTLYANLSNVHLDKLSENLTDCPLIVSGKGVFKEEFVTCGGVALNEIDFRTMESKKQSKLYFAGETLDIDGITGGFNFQNAWTTGWIAGTSAAQAFS